MGTYKLGLHQNVVDVTTLILLETEGRLSTRKVQGSRRQSGGQETEGKGLHGEDGLESFDYGSRLKYWAREKTKCCIPADADLFIFSVWSDDPTK